MGARVLTPRIVVAGTSSGAGKTTVATGLLAALQRRGMTPQGAKVDPDRFGPGEAAHAARRADRRLEPTIRRRK